MRFLDENIKLGIFPESDQNSSNLNNQNSKAGYFFNAYLENSAVETVIIDQQLPFTPISFVNDSVQLRTMYKVNFVFNVFSENRQEAIGNYDNLHDLLHIIKPAYNIVNYQYIPKVENLTGLVSLRFKGLPKLSKVSGVGDDQDRLKLHLTNFSYVTNNDMGFIEIPYDGTQEETTKLFVSGKMRLLPIAYKLTIAGRVLLRFEDTARTPSTSGIKKENKFTLEDILKQKVGGSSEYQQEILKTAKNLSTKYYKKNFASLDETNMSLLLQVAAKYRNESVIDADGNKNEFYWDQKNNTTTKYSDLPPSPPLLKSKEESLRDEKFAFLNKQLSTYSEE